MYLPYQIRAARGIANWTQIELAERAGLSHSAIRDAEDETKKRKTLAHTYEKIRAAFEVESIYFTERGAEKRTSSIYEISGDGWWGKVLDDVYYTLMDKKNAELLCMFIDDSKSPPDVVGRIRKIRNLGIRMRNLVRQGDTFIRGPIEEYRYVPKRYFLNYVTLIYGDKLAVCAENNTKAIITREPQLVETWRNSFEMLWQGVVLDKPLESALDEQDRY